MAIRKPRIQDEFAKGRTHWARYDGPEGQTAFLQWGPTHAYKYAPVTFPRPDGSQDWRIRDRFELEEEAA